MLARNILTQPFEAIQSFPDTVELQYDDGVVATTTRNHLLYTYYFWDFHRAYPSLPLLSRHHVDHVLKGKPLNSSTHIDLIQTITTDLYEICGLHHPKDKEPVYSLIYDTTNKVYNTISLLAEPHVSSIDILDFIELSEDPVIKDTVNKTEPTPQSIATAYESIIDRLSANELSHNPIVRAFKAKLVNTNQVLQCISFRGKMAEVNGDILPIPIMRNYTNGLNTLYNLSLESRAAAKSLYFSEAPLQDSEYFARRLQLLCMYVESISYTDCGSTKYLDWKIKPPSYNDAGLMVYPGDLVFMVGKYYLDEETNSLKVLTVDPSLYGKTIKLRSVLFCQHSNPHEVCEVCFGAIAKNITAYSNLGHLCAGTMTQQSSQSILSTKHLVTSAEGFQITLNELSSKFFKLTKDKSGYIPLDTTETIIVARDEAPGINDLVNIEDVSTINPSRISAIDTIAVVVETKTGHVPLEVKLAQGNKPAIMTTDFLEYIKTHHWRMSEDNNFIFDLSAWDYSKCMFRLPDTEQSFAEHAHLISSIIESSAKFQNKRLTPNSPVAVLDELFYVVNSKLKLNIAALEVLVYAATVESREKYGLNRNMEPKIMGVADKIITNRSLSNAYAYEGQALTITNPASFYYLDRPDSLFDVAITPEDVLKHKYV